MPTAAIRPMQHTDGPVLPISSWPMDVLQIFSVKVTEVMGNLEWPLRVYGIVAVRDSLDHKRNVLFRSDRDDCQTLTSPQASITFNVFIFPMIYTSTSLLLSLIINISTFRTSQTFLVLTAKLLKRT